MQWLSLRSFETFGRMATTRWEMWLFAENGGVLVWFGWDRWLSVTKLCG